MITVWLYGALAKQFGNKIKLNVASPAEAVQALEANHPGKFRQSLIGNSYNIVRGDSIESGEGDTEETLTLKRPGRDIHFVPIVEGGKKGIFQTILGVALIVVALSIPGGGFWLGEMAIEAASIAQFGAMMALGGVLQMLSPQPNISGLGGVSENVDPKKSFIFNGARNVTAQGVPVPLVYGEIEVGSVVISQSLTAERI